MAESRESARTGTTRPRTTRARARQVRGVAFGIRRRLARATRNDDSASWGKTVTATTRTVPISYRAAGRLRRRRRGLAREFAAPTATMIVARRSQSYAPERDDASDT